MKRDGVSLALSTTACTVAVAFGYDKISNAPLAEMHELLLMAGTFFILVGVVAAAIDAALAAVVDRQRGDGLTSWEELDEE